MFFGTVQLAPSIWFGQGHALALLMLLHIQQKTKLAAAVWGDTSGSYELEASMNRSCAVPAVLLPPVIRATGGVLLKFAASSYVPAIFGMLGQDPGG
jgi:hypothetical protein